MERAGPLPRDVIHTVTFPEVAKANLEAAVRSMTIPRLLDAMQSAMAPQADVNRLTERLFVRRRDPAVIELKSKIIAQTLFAQVRRLVPWGVEKALEERPYPLQRWLRAILKLAGRPEDEGDEYPGWWRAPFSLVDYLPVVEPRPRPQQVL